MERDLSPKRRHILSSFNPEIEANKRIRTDDATDEDDHRRYTRDRSSHRRHRDLKDVQTDIPTAAATEAVQTETADAGDDKLKPRAKTLRLKSRRSSRHRSRKNHDADDEDGEKRRRRRYRSKERHETRDRSRERHRSSRHKSHRHRHRTRSPTPENPYQEPALDPDAAFRESLFDALADDEGAAYWEGVYGQPLHVYASARDHGVANEQGELERMTDDEYASWVREQMWAKTHQGLLEEKERRAAARAAQQEQAKQDQRRRREARRLERQVEETLRAGEERRARRMKHDEWQRYLSAWMGWDGALERMPWPRGKVPLDGDEESVRAFFVDGMQDEEATDKARLIKEERVRWHPDKIQQRLGGQVDAETMKGVTMIFQVLDGLWAAARK
ncbi:hypothetical protein TD95_000399 [Thielaviopsis punctulata]|uniref:NF-kappa-B inhibitor-like protein 1 n=1 Tax=Thielaviopsis punctulata TaxID=72032 RepID=A0A0F4ZAG3_9PEZI|nr:hypothetical protein TD95_000399 [Thielaviopsis punctulata]